MTAAPAACPNITGQHLEQFADNELEQFMDNRSEQQHIILSQEQQKAIEKIDGASLLLAVPGSGKTTILISRMIIPDHSEPPVRTLRATIPESESHSPAVYSTVLLT